jgi:hypothetical protein
MMFILLGGRRGPLPRARHLLVTFHAVALYLCRSLPLFGACARAVRHGGRSRIARGAHVTRARPSCNRPVAHHPAVLAGARARGSGNGPTAPLCRARYPLDPCGRSCVRGRMKCPTALALLQASLSALDVVIPSTEPKFRVIAEPVRHRRRACPLPLSGATTPARAKRLKAGIGGRRGQ